MSSKRVVVTGASGLLGRAVLAAFQQSKWTVMGTAFSRTGTNLVRIDICNKEKTEEIIRNFMPTAIVHCAAQRFPDKVEQDVDGTVRLNVAATKNLANLAAELGAIMIYISTDYVFDGTKPPYSELDTTNPLNMYGKTKLQGEQVTLEASPNHIVLRVPVLYGPVEYLGESAVTVLLQLFYDSEGTKLVSDSEMRYPAHVDDIASICVDLLELKETNADVKGIYHWGGKEAMTKYGMVRDMASIFQLSMSHISPDPNPSQGTSRPQNAQLTNAKLENLAVGKHTPFRVGIESVLTGWVQRKKSEGL
ncbi:methionine adenosyltransferase 2 subunit beta isoform X1 [Daphnia magna]|uniref:methionine adenosyltransferase 2 subunit beta isoform X1 n=1 Tax=Daphnia magna TaxID=35525 RepID=UPI001E1BB3A1|nr:methionine adenosyltransferase 2 subunit beta isoform X1 [Daphnia magna]